MVSVRSRSIDVASARASETSWDALRCQVITEAQGQQQASRSWAHEQEQEDEKTSNLPLDEAEDERGGERDGEVGRGG